MEKSVLDTYLFVFNKELNVQAEHKWITCIKKYSLEAFGLTRQFFIEILCIIMLKVPNL